MLEQRFAIVRFGRILEDQKRLKNQKLLFILNVHILRN